LPKGLFYYLKEIKTIEYRAYIKIIELLEVSGVDITKELKYMKDFCMKRSALVIIA
jgi:hypothetical protein